MPVGIRDFYLGGMIVDIVECRS